MDEDAPIIWERPSPKPAISADVVILAVAGGGCLFFVFLGCFLVGAILLIREFREELVPPPDPYSVVIGVDQATVTLEEFQAVLNMLESVSFDSGEYADLGRENRVRRISDRLVRILLLYALAEEFGLAEAAHGGAQGDYPANHPGREDPAVWERYFAVPRVIEERLFLDLALRADGDPFAIEHKIQDREARADVRIDLSFFGLNEN